MKVQLKDIVLAVPALSKLSAGDLQLRLAYKLKRMITALQKEADFFAEQRQKIFEMCIRDSHYAIDVAKSYVWEE